MAHRRIFVGDLQGCRDELDALLEEAAFDPSRDRLYCVGDAVNRGPDSVGCLRRLMELDAVMVLGNHEMHLFEVLAGRRKLKGRDTMQDVLEARDRDVLVDWLRQRPILHVEDDIVMVHAAISPAWDPDDLPGVAARLRQEFEQSLDDPTGAPRPDLSFAVSVRYCDAEGNPAPRWRPPPEAPFLPWDFHWSGHRTVVFGHWAQRGLVARDRVRGLDTGCVYGRVLSAWIAEEDRFVQVPAARPYSPKTDPSTIPVQQREGPEPRRRVCVFCGSAHGDALAFTETARRLGAELVRRDYGVVYGAGNVGLMGELADAALERGGEVIGVIPKALVDMEVCHGDLSELHVVDGMHPRKMKMQELSDAFIALPGGLGTLEELFELLTWQQLGFHDKPVAILDVDGYWDHLLAQLDVMRERGFVRDEHLRRCIRGTSIEEVLEALEAAWTAEG